MSPASKDLSVGDPQLFRDIAELTSQSSELAAPYGRGWSAKELHRRLRTA
jgi:hypothetical protein